MVLPVNFGSLAAGKQNLSLLDTQFAAVEPLITFLSNTTVGDIALNNTATFFTGPTVAQGTAGTWLAMGTVVLVDTVGGAIFNAVLGDGVTSAAAEANTASSNAAVCISLSIIITSPAGNIRITAKDGTSTSGKIVQGSSMLALRLA